MVRVLSAAVFAAALALMVLGCVISRRDFLVLAADRVLRPADVSVLMWSAGVLVSFVLVGAVALRLRPTASSSVGVVVSAGVALAVVTVMTGAWCFLVLAFTQGSAALGVEGYTVLRPSGDDGCVVIAHEGGELRISSGAIYLVHSTGVAHPVGSWSANEIQLPIRDGDYSLSWSGSVGRLVLQAERFISQSEFLLTCER